MISKHIHKVLFVVCFFTITSITAQNLVSNGGFENYNNGYCTLSPYTSNYEIADGWFNATSAVTGSTSDAKCNSTIGAAPLFTAGAFAGTGTIGFSSGGVDPSNFSEGIRTNLSTTIAAGSTITITISTARNRGIFSTSCFCFRNSKGYTSGPASDPNHLYGIYFYNSGTTIPSTGSGLSHHLTVTPQVVLTCPSGLDTWMTQTVTYVTPVAVSKVAIGFFSPYGNTPSGTRYFSIDEVSITSNPCGSCSISTSSASSLYTWSGCVDSDWFDPCNWDTGTVPTFTKSVLIPNTTNKPLITGATADCNDITIQSSLGARLDINSSAGGLLNIHAQ